MSMLGYLKPCELFDFTELGFFYSSFNEMLKLGSLLCILNYTICYRYH